MSVNKKSEVLQILQPDLLSVEQLVEIIESRCCRASNLRSLTKEALVSLFRRLALPLPQRLYRANRRGQMLTARRAKLGLDSASGGRKEERSQCPNGRLKPPPDISRRNEETSRSGESDRDSDGKTSRPESRKITLKRPSSSSEKPTNETASPSDSKKQRTAIRWP